ncbi:MAG TPA: MFS transporter [Polyangiaceae bacterium]
MLAVQLGFGYAFSSFFLLPKFVVTELGGGPRQVGTVGALAVMTAVLASPLSGWLLDRGSRRPLVILGTLLGVASSLAFVGVTELGPYLYGARAVQGLAYTLFYVAAGTLVADLAPPSRLGQALGVFGAAALMMNAVATLIAERIAHDFGWRAVFVTAAAVGALAVVLACFLREPARPSQGQSASSLAAHPGPFAALSGKLPVLWAALAGGAAFGVMFTFTQPFALSLGDTQVSPLFAGYTAMALVVRVAFGRLADRAGRARVGGWALAFYALVVACAAGLERGWLAPLGLAFGLAHGVFYPALNALALEGAERGQRGSISAYFNAAFNLGILLVTAGLGHVAEQYGYRVVFLLVALLTASGCPLFWSQMRRKPWLARPLSE